MAGAKKHLFGMSFFFTSISAVIYLFATQSMVFLRHDWNWLTFREFSLADQLAYFAFTMNTVTGQETAVEPFAVSGGVYYPHAYYVFLGWVSNIFSIDPIAMWLILGVTIQVTLLVCISIVSILLTRRAWVGAFSFLPFIVGTLAYVQDGQWLVTLSSHAALWGSFATLYILNGEAAGLAIASLANLGFISVLFLVKSRRTRIILLIVSGFLVGLLGSIQTYSFITEVYLLVFIAAAYGLFGLHKKQRIIQVTISLVLIALLFVFGALLAELTNPVLVLFLGLAPAIPGLIAILRTHLAQLWIPAAAIGLTALPPVSLTLLGVLQEDPFLEYRTQSSSHLGVPFLQGFVSSLPVLIPLTFFFFYSFASKKLIWSSIPAGVITVWILLGSNEIWGANQEPYRLWIDTFIIVALSAFPLFLFVFFGRKQTSKPLDNLVGQEPATRGFKKSKLSFLIVSSLVVGVSLIDWTGFYRVMLDKPLVQISTPRNDALKELVSSIPNELIMTDLCIEPIMFKAVTGKPVVHINLGMAWPDNALYVMTTVQNRGKQIFDVPVMQEAGVKYVITDSKCDSEWITKNSENLSYLVQESYDSGEFTLWKFS